MKKILLSIFSLIFVCSVMIIGFTADNADAELKAIVKNATNIEESYRQYINSGDLSGIKFESGLTDYFYQNVDNKFSIGETVILPRIVYDESNYTLKVIIQKDNRIIKTIDSLSEKEEYTFRSLGNYSFVYALKNIKDSTITAYSASCVCIDDIFFDVDVRFADNLYAGSVNVLPTATAIYQKQKVMADIAVTTSNGRPLEVVGGSVLIDKKDEYTLSYSATINGKSINRQITLSSVYSGSGLFSSVIGNNKIIGGYDLPDYSVEGNGILLYADSSNSKFRFNNILDVSKAEKDVNIIQFQLLSLGEFTPLKNVYVTLTDVENPNNFIKTRFFPYWGDMEQLYVMTTHDDTYRAVSNVSGSMGKIFTAPGFFNTAGHFDCTGVFDSALIAMQFDFKESQMFVHKLPAKDGVNYQYMLLDFKDPNHVGFNNIWQGFPSGKVYLDIAFDGNLGPGGVVVTEIMGQSLSGKIIDDKNPPVISVNTSTDCVESGIFPPAAVDRNYKIPNASAFDIITGETNVTVSVIDPLGNEVDFRGDSFVPSLPGEYIVRYSASDFNGNSACKNFIINCKPFIDNIEIEWLSSPEIAYAGSNYKIPPIMVTGGSGNYLIDFKVLYNDEEIMSNDYAEFFLNKVGKITVKAVVKDYLNSPMGTDSLSIEVIAPEKPVLFVNGVPHAAKVGTDIVFPEFDAIDYSFEPSEIGYNPSKAIYVNGKLLGKDRKYSVTQNDLGLDLNVVYRATSGTQTSSKNYQIKVFDATAVKDYILFDRSPSNLIAGAAYTDILLKKGDTTIFTPNEVLTLQLDLEFGVLSDNNNLESVEVRLEDFFNENNVVTFHFIKKVSGASGDLTESYLVVNGNFANKIVVKGSFFNNDNLFNLVFDGRNNILKTNLGETVTPVTTNLRGERFAGFTNNLARISIIAHGVSDDNAATIRLTKIGNQVFNKAEEDLTGAQFETSQEFGSLSVAPGQTVYIPEGFACDVLNGGSFDVSVTMKGPDGTILFSGNKEKNFHGINYTFSDKLGTYSVIYSADGKEIKNIRIKVIDVVPPTISLNKDLPDTISLNESLIVPEVTVHDDVSSKCKYYITIYNPNRVSVNIQSGTSYTFKQEGLFVIVVVAYDNSNNYSVCSYTINVVKR